MAAARERGVPLAVLDVDSDESASLYPCKLLLSRPDQHVAWRGNAQPKDAVSLIDRIRGASQTSRTNQQRNDLARRQYRSEHFSTAG
jgi:hypothetical protein